VDDIFYVSTDKALTNEFLRKVESRFGKVKHMDSNIIPFLGMRYDASGKVSVDQPADVEELVADIWEESIHSSPSHKDLLARSSVGDKLLDRKDYRSRVAKVMYLATKT
jgi:hypothetical protein